MPAQNITFMSSPHITEFPHFKLDQNNCWKIKNILYFLDVIHLKFTVKLF